MSEEGGTMTRSTSCPIVSALLTALLILSPTATSLQPGQEQKTAAAGDYEFDLSDAGMDPMILKIYVEDGALWVRTASAAPPDELVPVAGRDNAYTINDPHEGLYEVEFLEEAEGRYTRARLKNGAMGLDIVGTRLEESVHFPTLQEVLISREGLTETRMDLNGVRAAIYFGRGMDGHSALAIGRALQWMGCDVEIADADSIKGGILDELDVLAFPGGATTPDPWRELGVDGTSRIKSFVRNGGGYIGICLGAVFAAETSEFWGTRLGVDELYLKLFPGVAHCGQEDIAPQGGWPLMIDLEVADHDHPITAELPGKIRVVMYPNGPYLQPSEGGNVTTVATFVLTGNPAMVAFEYGKGRVFLSGPHPEIEVDSDRDGSSLFDELSDQGSEWPLLLAVMKWMTAAGELGDGR
jgi:glutamine amidotransferase-like uncharacterized protein